MSNMEHNLQPPIKGERPRVEWGRAVVDAINAGRVSGGRGVLVSQDQTGTVLKLKRVWPQVRDEDPPMPFDLVVETVDGVSVLQAWLPGDPTMLVSRNGLPAAFRASGALLAYPISDGWISLAHGDISSGVWYVWIEILDEGGDYAWQIRVEAPDATGIDAMPDLAGNRSAELRLRRNRTPFIVGAVEDGSVRQRHRGRIATYYAAPDAENGDFASLDYDEDEQRLQLRNFSDLEDVLDEAPSMDEEHYDEFQVVCRQAVSTGAAVQYCPLGLLAEALVDTITQPYEPREPWQDAWDNYIGDRVINIFTAGAIEQMTLIYNTLDARYWIKGGDVHNCYGSSIGNAGGAGGAVVIDLANYRLMRSTGIKTVDWEAMELWTTKLSIDWADRQLWDGAAVQNSAADWNARELHDADGEVSARWGDRQLICATNNLPSLDWELCYLYKISQGLADKLTLDWGNCALWDPASWGGQSPAVPTLVWNTRTLNGTWTVATGGSLATPKLTLGGTDATGISTVAVVTAVDFANQTVTTQNLKVLT